ncbi:hypothetical protein SBADM41S_08048 [Streptomyces badius]
MQRSAGRGRRQRRHHPEHLGGYELPAPPLPTGSSSAYVTPGSGEFFRQFKGSTTSAGFLFLVTDTGLRYAMQSNSDSGQDDSGIGESGSKKERESQRLEEQQAQNRLGYKDVDPQPRTRDLVLTSADRPPALHRCGPPAAGIVTMADTCAVGRTVPPAS